MKFHIYKYQGTGNDFVILDNRNGHFPKTDSILINKLCDRRYGVGADGLILLENAINTDFKMVYYNADGNESTMCGNGGRCLVAFANKLKIIGDIATFDAIDGFHSATIKNDIVSLQMKDVNGIKSFDSHVFLDTGSPHHVEFVYEVDKIDIKETGRKIRNGAPYFEEGTNVNFAELINKDTIKVRTYERGVEDETLSCGTGVTAVAIAAHYNGIIQDNTVNIEAQGGTLSIQFERENNEYSNIFLTGPATFVFESIIEL